jgi:hypothetical protein
MEAIHSQPVITRAELNSLKALQEEENHKRFVNQKVTEIRGTIIATARTTDRKSLFISECEIRNVGIVSSSDPKTSLQQIVSDVITGLQAIFPDISIEYKSQKCLRTGKKLNQGIYIDWS